MIEATLVEKAIARPRRVEAGSPLRPNHAATDGTRISLPSLAGDVGRPARLSTSVPWWACLVGAAVGRTIANPSAAVNAGLQLAFSSGRGMPLWSMRLRTEGETMASMRRNSDYGLPRHR